MSGGGDFPRSSPLFTHSPPSHSASAVALPTPRRVTYVKLVCVLVDLSQQLGEAAISRCGWDGRREEGRQEKVGRECRGVYTPDGGKTV